MNYDVIPSKVKSIYIGLPDYQFQHSSDYEDDSAQDEGTRPRYKYFVGREKSMNRLRMLLNTVDNRGVYLVAGYRGMGKTSLVKRVIGEFNIEKKTVTDSYWPIYVSLSQDDIKDYDVLKLLASQLALEWNYKIDSGDFDELNPTQAHAFSQVSKRLVNLSNRLNSIGRIRSNTKFHDKLRVSEHEERPIEYETEQEWVQREFITKEVERELLYILRLIDDLRKKKEKIKQIPRLIFILDELDKIEPNFFYRQDYNQPAESEIEADNIFGDNKVRKRQEVIAKLLGNLKSFLTSAKAKFIFIGGREMYDASLADIADRDSFYSSIFHDVIYIESFFKDKTGAQSGLTHLTEMFLCKLIIPESYLVKYNKQNKQIESLCGLSVYYRYLIDNCLEKKGIKKKFSNADISDLKEEDGEKKKEIYKLILFLQNFIVFLVFRSNGTPKKLVALMESFIEQVKIENSDRYIVAGKYDGDLFLHFSYKKQYEIVLTANIYRPYIIIYSRHLKSLEDKLLYSTSYIFDYLFKFHANAFSWRNLELIPEIILLNKDANLRYFISDIMHFLSSTYIRETINGIFQYKFFSKPSHEIQLLTKISETAAAAFSFTLDESQQIIRYYRRKLNLLRNTYPNYQKEHIYSIGFIEALLGDLYYFDKAYDEAIIYYSNSLQVLRQMANQAPHKMTNHQVVLYVKNKLHLGLCYEKIKAFDSAFTVYRNLMLKIPQLLDKILEQTLGTYIDKEWDKPIRRMHLMIKPYIAILDLIEKQRIDGVTYANLIRSYKEVYEFLVDVKVAKPSIGQGIIELLSKQKMDTMRSALMLSDYYNNVGSLLFFKNRNFPELHQVLYDQKMISDENRNLFTFIQKRRSVVENYCPSISSFTYYYLALKELIDSYDPQLKTIKNYNDGENAIIKSVYLLRTECKGIADNTLFLIFGNTLSRLGDSLVGCLNKPQRLMIAQELLNLYGDEDFDETAKPCVQEILIEIKRFLIKKIKGKECVLSGLIDINIVFLIYRLAGLFYMKANKNFSYSFQYKKFLFLIKDSLSFEEKIDDLEKIVENTAERIFNINTWLIQGANRPQVAKYRQMFSGNNISLNPEETHHIYLNLSNSPEIRETIALVEGIKLRLLKKQANYKKEVDHEGLPKIDMEINRQNLEEKIQKFSAHLTPYDLVSSRYTRTYELKLQAEINYAKIKSINSGKILEILTSPILINFELLGLISSKDTDQYNYMNLCKTLIDLIHSISLNQLEFKKTEISSAIEAKVDSKKLNELKINQITDEIISESERALRIFSLCKCQCQQIIGRKNDDEPQNNDIAIRNLILDSIFALFEVIKNLNISGTSYVNNHSFLASVHRNLADWYVMAINYDSIREIAKNNWNVTGDQKKLEDNLHKLLGAENMPFLDPDYHYELAVYHYNAAIQTHNGGSAYKKLNQNMSFLEDDFNDNLTHFSAALERFRINNGTIEGHLNNLKERMKYSNLYSYKSYRGRH